MCYILRYEICIYLISHLLLLRNGQIIQLKQKQTHKINNNQPFQPAKKNEYLKDDL
jgi:hypothetical protein